MFQLQILKVHLDIQAQDLESKKRDTEEETEEWCVCVCVFVCVCVSVCPCVFKQRGCWVEPMKLNVGINEKTIILPEADQSLTTEQLLPNPLPEVQFLHSPNVSNYQHTYPIISDKYSPVKIEYPPNYPCSPYQQDLKF